MRTHITDTQYKGTNSIGILKLPLSAWLVLLAAFNNENRTKEGIRPFKFIMHQLLLEGNYRHHCTKYLCCVFSSFHVDGQEKITAVLTHCLSNCQVIAFIFNAYIFKLSKKILAFFRFWLFRNLHFLGISIFYKEVVLI